jgi:hypothetical protein
MDYTPQLQKAFKEALYEDWMDEEDWQELESEMLKQVGTSYKEMSKQIEVGIKNGASLDMQLNMIKKLFSNTH